LTLSFKVVICTRDRPEPLRRCLESLRCVDYPGVATLIVDSASVTDEVRRLSAEFGAAYIRASEPGLSRARNIGLQSVDADIVAFLDDDMEPHVQWLQALADGFAADDVAVVTGPMLGPDSRDGDDAYLLECLDASTWGAEPFRVDRASPDWFERANFGGTGDGNFALRRRALDRFDGFDEELGRGAVLRGGEDHYAFFQLIESGHGLVYAPRAVVFHPVAAKDRQAVRRRAAEAIGYALFLVMRRPKWTGKVMAHFARGVFGVQRPKWASDIREGGRASRIDQGMGALQGALLFLKSRMLRLGAAALPPPPSTGREKF
jgi:GT2 family glycosyltransferase